MSKLGLALLAADEYYKEGDRRQVRDYNQRLRDADLSVLDDRVAAQRSGYQLSQVRNRADIDLAPGAAANNAKKQQYESGEWDTKLETQPDTQATAKENAARALLEARGKTAEEPFRSQTSFNNAKVDAELSAAKVDDLPNMVAQFKLKGVMDDVAAQTHISAKVADLVDAGDQSSLVRLMNAQKRVLGTSDQKFASMPDVASVSKARNQQGEEFLVLKDAQGNQIAARRVADYQKARASLGKRETKVLKPGDTIGQADANGNFTASYTAPVDKSVSSAHTPASLQEAKWVMENKNNPEAMQAWEKVRSSRGGRKEFVQALIAKGASSTDTPAELREKANAYGALFDEISRSGGGQGGAAPQGAQMDPQISNLLGIPPR